MAYYPATSFVPQFFSDPGVPLAGGSISAQIAGSSTPTPMYLDGSGTSAGTSITLNARGEPQVSGNTIIIWLDSDVSYKFILKDASAVSKWTIDAISNPNFGLSDTTNPLLGDYLIGTHRTGAGAVAMRTHYWIETRTYNVKDFVDPTVTTTDWTAAINLAYARIPSTGGILEFPEGDFAFNTALSFTNAKPVVIKGQGAFATRLKPTFAAGDAITINGTGYFAIQDLFVAPTINRNTGTYNVRVKNCTYVIANNVDMNNGTGGLWMFEAGNWLRMHNCQGDSNSGTAGDTCLRLKSHGGEINNVVFRTGPFSGGYSSSKPCFYLTGQTTSLRLSNCDFAGGGPRSTWNISSITSTGANFTVTTTASHDFGAGDFIAIRGASVAAYNTAWRIASVTSTTVVVTTTLNPGTATAQGTAESLSACGFISNEDGAVNECQMENVLFEAVQLPNLYGTVGCYFDARRGPAGTAREISGWTISNVYCDFGAIGMLFSGKALSASNDPSCFGFSVAGLKCESITRSLHIEGAQNITVNGFVGNSNQTPATDRIGLDATGSPRPFEIYIAAGLAVPYTQGITINGGNIGMVADWLPALEARSKDNGVFLAGLGAVAVNLQDIVIAGNNIYGRQFAIGDDGSAVFPTTRMKIRNNNLSYAGIGSNSIPSVASATSTTISTYHDTVKITGTTNIQTLLVPYVGREVTLIFTGALSLVTGGNLAIAANYSVLAGQSVNLYFDGTSWYLK